MDLVVCIFSMDYFSPAYYHAVVLLFFFFSLGKLVFGHVAHYGEVLSPI